MAHSAPMSQPLQYQELQLTDGDSACQTDWQTEFRKEGSITEATGDAS
jgi:hypothetical protein